MTPSVENRKLQGTKPEWLNLPRRPCDNCGKRYKPTRPTSRFCKSECKTSFHRHGGAYRKLKQEIEKEIKRQMNLTETCPECKGKGKIKMKGAEITCPNIECSNGKQLTTYGRRLINAIQAFTSIPT